MIILTAASGAAFDQLSMKGVDLQLIGTQSK
jgi:hypothetical protein